MKMVGQQQLPLLLLFVLAASSAAAAGVTPDKPAETPSPAAQQQQQQQLPQYVKVVLAYDGIDQDTYTQSYRLGSRLAVAFAAGVEGNRSSVLSVTNGDFEGAVAAYAFPKGQRQARNKTQANAVADVPTNSPAAPAASDNTTPTTAPATGDVGSPAASAAAEAPAQKLYPAPSPLGGARKWLAGIIAPALTPGGGAASMAKSSNRRLQSWRALLSMQQQVAADSLDVPATVETISPAAAAPASTPEAAAAPAPAAKVGPAPAADDAQTEPGAPAAAAAPAADDAQFEDVPASSGDIPFENVSGPLQALGEFAIVTEHPEDVRKHILEAASNFGMGFYSLLHKFGVAQKPSLYLDGTPIAGPAAEAVNPAAYSAAAAAAGLINDPEELHNMQTAADEDASNSDSDLLSLSTPAEDDPLPDARIAPRPNPATRSPPVRIGEPRGFEQIVQDANAAAHQDNNSSKTIDGVPIWVVAPLAVLASLFGLVLIAAAAMFGVRVVRSCRVGVAAAATHKSERGARRRRSNDSSIESGSEPGSESGSDEEDEVFGPDLIKHQHGGYLATTKALEQFNGLEKGKTTEEDDRATITSLQTGVTAATTYLSTSGLLDGQPSHNSSSNSRPEKPIVSGIRVPSRTELYNASLDGLLTAAGITAATTSARATTAPPPPPPPPPPALPAAGSAAVGSPIKRSGLGLSGFGAPPPPPPPPPPPAPLARVSPMLPMTLGGPPPPAPPPPPFPLTRSSPASSPRVLARNSSGPGGVLQPPAGLMVRTRIGAAAGPENNNSAAMHQGSPSGGSRRGTPTMTGIDPQAIAKAAAAAAARRAQSQSIGN